MRRKMRPRGTRERGLTLIEIMVVLLIIGLISAAVAVAAFDQYDDAKRKRAASDLRTIHNALKLYHLKHGSYPPVQGWTAALGKVVEEIPIDPWNRPYVYFLENGQPVVVTYGADGQPGGSGNDEDQRRPGAR